MAKVVCVDGAVEAKQADYFLMAPKLQDPFLFKFGIGLDETDSMLTIKFVAPGKPGMKAGMKVGDVIRTVNGVPVRTSLELQGVIWTVQEGDDVNVTMVRPRTFWLNQKLTLKVKAERGEEED
jgi:S1-C subfamily serine protease